MRQLELPGLGVSEFDGDDYVPERDKKRLTGQLKDIWNVVRDGKKRTLSEIEELTGYPQASISAQLRHLRKRKFGSHQVHKEYVRNGLYRYWVVANVAI